MGTSGDREAQLHGDTEGPGGASPWGRRGTATRGRGGVRRNTKAQHGDAGHTRGHAARRATEGPPRPPGTHIQRGLRPIPAPRRGAEGDVGAGAARRGPRGGHGAVLCRAAHGVQSGGVGRLHPAGGRQLRGQRHSASRHPPPSSPSSSPLLLNDLSGQGGGGRLIGGQQLGWEGGGRRKVPQRRRAGGGGGERLGVG